MGPISHWVHTYSHIPLFSHISSSTSHDQLTTRPSSLLRVIGCKSLDWFTNCRLYIKINITRLCCLELSFRDHDNTIRKQWHHFVTTTMMRLDSDSWLARKIAMKQAWKSRTAWLSLRWWILHEWMQLSAMKWKKHEFPTTALEWTPLWYMNRDLP